MSDGLCRTATRRRAVAAAAAAQVAAARVLRLVVVQVVRLQRAIKSVSSWWLVVECR